MQEEVARLRSEFRNGRLALFRAVATPRRAGDLLSAYSDLVDGVVRVIYDVSCRNADRQFRRGPRSGLAIVATGGYGRRELNPFSDIDIAFIPGEEEDPWVEAAVHEAFKLVMDVFLSSREVQVGYSFRPVSETPTWDLCTRTALLDARFLCGRPELSVDLGRALRRCLSPLDIALETRASRDPRSGEASCLYSVEPRLKEGPGSLRDLHRGRWILKLLAGDIGADLWPALVSSGYLSAAAAELVQAAALWFWEARNWLHLATGRRSDTVINNYQDRIARELGGLSAQEWLSRHYRHAETLLRFREGAVRQSLRGPVDLGVAQLREGCLDLPDCGGATDSGARVLHLSQHYGVPLSPKTEDRLAEARGLPAPSGRLLQEEAWAVLRILNEPAGVGATVRKLAALGILDRVIEGFSSLMRFAPPDPAHRFTVGEHSLQIISSLEALRDRSDVREGRFSELLSECTHFDVLCLAALLHDAGKAIPGTDHSVSSAGLGAEVAARLGLAPEKARLLDTLIRHHLLLVRTSRLQDLKSAAVIQRVAEQCESPEALCHLYVFTYVDTQAVGGNSWTSMDFRGLEELYRKVQDHLAGRSPDAFDTGAVKDKIVQIRRRLSSTSGDAADAILRHCDTMPASYILNTPLEEIALHLQLLDRLESEGVVLDVYNRPGEDFSELTVCTYDDPQPGMLAKIAGVLFGCNTDIHRAQVFTIDRPRPVVLDTLWVRAAGHQLTENRVRRLQAALRSVLTGERTLDQLLQASGKRPPAGIPLDNVSLRNDLSTEHTVVHVIARDLQGLLYLMTRALSRSGLHIHSAKVATWNARAENNFYVTTLSGGQLPDADLAAWEERLAELLRGFGAGDTP